MRRRFSPGLPSPRSLAVASICLFLGGALLGAAWSPPPSTLAASARRIVVVMVPPAAPAVTPPAPAEPVPSDDVEPLPADDAAPEPAPVEPSAPLEEPAPVAEEPAPVEDGPEEEPAPELPSVGHVFLVMLQGAPDQLPDDLVGRGQLLTAYAPPSTSPLANRIALISGQEPTPDTEAGCPDYDACVYPAEAKT